MRQKSVFLQHSLFKFGITINFHVMTSLVKYLHYSSFMLLKLWLLAPYSMALSLAKLPFIHLFIDSFIYS